MLSIDPLPSVGTIDDPSEGKVNLFGETVDKQSSDAFKADLRLRRIGFVFQTFNLLATLSAFENVELPMIVLGKLSRAESKRRAKALLDMVGLRDRYSHLPSELSGGEQQRVAVSPIASHRAPRFVALTAPSL